MIKITLGMSTQLSKVYPIFIQDRAEIFTLVRYW
nr:MAG TPA: hypothetical protein [Bacteriophage sp.]